MQSLPIVQCLPLLLFVKMTSLINKLRWSYIRNNIQSCFFTIAYICVSLGFFIYRYLEYRVTNFPLAIARASAYVIYLQNSMILILILRKSITFLRSNGFAHYLPLDHYVYFHKMTGWSIAFFGLLHTLAHLYNFANLTTITTISYMAFLFSIDIGIGWMWGAACLTGWLLVLILLIMLVLSLNFVRRSGKFELFYYSHKLYILYFILMIIHGKLSWRFLLLPCLLLLFEKISSFIKTNKDQHGLTYAIEGTLLPSRVLRLVIRKPKLLVFNPGDFVYVMVPSITQYEWHPITISSAPEDENITIHIRAVGEWTNRIYDHFDHAKTLSLKNMLEEWRCLEFHPRFGNQGDSANPENRESSPAIQKRTMILPIPEDCDEDGCMKKKSSHSRSKENNGIETNAFEMSELVESTSVDSKVMSDSGMDLSVSFIKSIQKDVQSNVIFLKEPLKICLDGPYGAPSSNIFNSEHAVLIATGIGVTPFASILQSIMYRHIEKKRHCPNCSHTWTERVPSQRIMNLKKVDFVWINRDQTSFEWFVELLSNLNKQQFGANGPNEVDEHFLDIHMYVTGHGRENRNRERSNTSVLAKCKNSLNWKYGRPDWEEFFSNLRDENRGRVTVFYCGRPDLAAILRNHCSRYNCRFKKEVF